VRSFLNAGAEILLQMTKHLCDHQTAINNCHVEAAAFHIDQQHGSLFFDHDNHFCQAVQHLQHKPAGANAAVRLTIPSIDDCREPCPVAAEMLAVARSNG